MVLKDPAPQWLCSLWASVLWVLISTPHPNCNLVSFSSLSPQQQTSLLLCDQDQKGGLKF